MSRLVPFGLNNALSFVLGQASGRLPTRQHEVSELWATAVLSPAGEPRRAAVSQWLSDPDRRVTPAVASQILETHLSFGAPGSYKASLERSKGRRSAGEPVPPSEEAVEFTNRFLLNTLRYVARGVPHDEAAVYGHRAALRGLDVTRETGRPLGSSRVSPHTIGSVDILARLEDQAGWSDEIEETWTQWRAPSDLIDASIVAGEMGKAKTRAVYWFAGGLTVPTSFKTRLTPELAKATVVQEFSRALERGEGREMMQRYRELADELEGKADRGAEDIAEDFARMLARIAAAPGTSGRTTPRPGTKALIDEVAELARIRKRVQLATRKDESDIAYLRTMATWLRQIAVRMEAALAIPGVVKEAAEQPAEAAPEVPATPDGAVESGAISAVGQAPAFPPPGPDIMRLEEDPNEVLAKHYARHDSPVRLRMLEANERVVRQVIQAVGKSSPKFESFRLKLVDNLVKQRDYYEAMDENARRLGQAFMDNATTVELLAPGVSRRRRDGSWTGTEVVSLGDPVPPAPPEVPQQPNLSVPVPDVGVRRREPMREGEEKAKQVIPSSTQAAANRNMYPHIQEAKSFLAAGDLYGALGAMRRGARLEGQASGAFSDETPERMREAKGIVLGALFRPDQFGGTDTTIVDGKKTYTPVTRNPADLELRHLPERVGRGWSAQAAEQYPDPNEIMRRIRDFMNGPLLTPGGPSAGPTVNLWELSEVLNIYVNPIVDALKNTRNVTKWNNEPVVPRAPAAPAAAGGGAAGGRVLRELPLGAGSLAELDARAEQLLTQNVGKLMPARVEPLPGRPGWEGMIDPDSAIVGVCGVDDEGNEYCVDLHVRLAGNVSGAETGGPGVTKEERARGQLANQTFSEMLSGMEALSLMLNERDTGFGPGGAKYNRWAGALFGKESGPDGRIVDINVELQAAYEAAGTAGAKYKADYGYTRPPQEAIEESLRGGGGDESLFGGPVGEVPITPRAAAAHAGKAYWKMSDAERARLDAQYKTYVHPTGRKRTK